MSTWIDIPKNEPHLKREKRKARELRQTNWWKQQLAKGICYYCHRHFAPEELTMDHIVPLARGGKSAKSNVVPCCKECNNRKKYLTPVEIVLQETQDTKND